MRYCGQRILLPFCNVASLYYGVVLIGAIIKTNTKIFSNTKIYYFSSWAMLLSLLSLLVADRWCWKFCGRLMSVKIGWVIGTVCLSVGAFCLYASGPMATMLHHCSTCQIEQKLRTSFLLVIRPWQNVISNWCHFGNFLNKMNAKLLGLSKNAHSGKL